MVAKEKKPSLAQMLAKFEGIKFEPKELVDNWLLLTYDLPANEEGGKARYAFMKKAPKIGAVMHTRSVYLIPWSEKAELAALEVTKHGTAFLWTSAVTDEDKKKEVTEFYDKSINEKLDEAEDRINRIKDHQKENELRSANRMIRKTGEFIGDAANSALLRQSIPLMTRALELYKKLMEVNSSDES